MSNFAQLVATLALIHDPIGRHIILKKIINKYGIEYEKLGN